MIRKELKRGWILFTQNDHARLAGDIMKHWGNEMFSGIEPFGEVMHAIDNHDLGWIAWDNLPKINESSGYPANFMEMHASEQKEIWSDSFENDYKNHSYSSALIALHFSKLNEKSLMNDPEDKDALELQEKINNLIDSVFDINYTSLMDNNLPADVMTNLKFVQIGDIISLALCHGWKSTELLETPVDYEGNTIDMSIKSEDGFRYIIEPNPFSREKLDIDITGRRLLKKMFASDEELRIELSKSQPEKFYFTIE